MKTAYLEELTEYLNNVEVDKIGVAELSYLGDFKGSATQELLPGAQSIIILALELLPETVNLLTSHLQIGALATRAVYQSTMDTVSGRLGWETYQIVKKLHCYGYHGLPLPASDETTDQRFLEGAFSYKHAAQAAGLGKLGWSSMLLTPEFGPRVRLACVLTDAPLKSTPQKNNTSRMCDTCQGACMRACPSHAIQKPAGDETYHFDKFRCNAYLNAVGSCSECLKVCPAGKLQCR